MPLTTSLETLLWESPPWFVRCGRSPYRHQLGKDFRADYWFLGDYLERQRRNGSHFPVLCLTATAVYGGQDDVAGYHRTP